jgi:D-sedoheptulose 7-phosphate isomerase
VGKRALPALDISMLFRPWLEAILHPEDIVMGFGPPEGDDEVRSALEFAQARNALTFSLPGVQGSVKSSVQSNYAVEAFTQDPFIHQEMIEILYHVLWESVHVFLEHRELGHEVGEAGFLYPFLGQQNRRPTIWSLRSRPRSG